jgi:hypothetical protein
MIHKNFVVLLISETRCITYTIVEASNANVKNVIEVNANELFSGLFLIITTYVFIFVSFADMIYGFNTFQVFPILSKDKKFY